MLSTIADLGGGRLFLFLFCLVGGMFLFFAPLGLGISAATFTARDARAEAFDLLLLSNLTEAQIVWGYWGAIIRRLRWRGILLTPLIPYTLIFTSLVFSLAFLSDWRMLASWFLFVGITVGSYSGWDWSSHMLGLIAGLALRNMLFIREMVGASLLFSTGLWAWGLLKVFSFVDAWVLGQSVSSYPFWQVGPCRPMQLASPGVKIA